MLFSRPRCPECESRWVVRVPGATIAPNEPEFTAIQSEHSATEPAAQEDPVSYYRFFQCLRCFHGFNLASTED